MPLKFKKLDENKFERTETNSTITILNKEQLEKTKKFLEENITKFQAQLDWVNQNLDGINKAK